MENCIHLFRALVCLAPGILRAWLETHDGYTPDSCSELKSVSCMLSQGMEIMARYSSRTIL